MGTNRTYINSGTNSIEFDESNYRPTNNPIIYHDDLYSIIDNLDTNNTLFCFIITHNNSDDQKQGINLDKNIFTQYFTQPNESCTNVGEQFTKTFLKQIEHYLKINNSLSTVLSKIEHSKQFHPQPVINNYFEHTLHFTVQEHYGDLYVFDGNSFIRFNLKGEYIFSNILKDLIRNYSFNNIYVGLIICRGGENFDRINNLSLQNCNSCKNCVPPCCNKDTQGEHCAFLPFSNEEIREQEHDEYKTIEEQYYLSGQIPDSLNQKQILDLEHTSNLREQWMQKHLKPECYNCDSDCKNHLGRIQVSKNKVNKYKNK